VKNKPDKLRTLKQNRALHKFFSELADELNDRGQYIGKVIKIDAEWNGDRVKELIWREVQKKMTGKTSTTQLTTKEIDEIFGVLHQAFASRGIDLQWPSIETLMMNSRIKEGR